jgi:hypothetical protein
MMATSTDLRANLLVRERLLDFLDRRAKVGRSGHHPYSF